MSTPAHGLLAAPAGYRCRGCSGGSDTAPSRPLSQWIGDTDDRDLADYFRDQATPMSEMSTKRTSEWFVPFVGVPTVHASKLHGVAELKYSYPGNAASVMVARLVALALVSGMALMSIATMGIRDAYALLRLSPSSAGRVFRGGIEWFFTSSRPFRRDAGYERVRGRFTSNLANPQHSRYASDLLFF